MLLASGCDTSGSQPDGSVFSVVTPQGIVQVDAESSQPSDLTINLNDTHLVMTVAIETQSVITTDLPVYNADTGQPSTQVNLDIPDQHYHVEAGYDATGALVFNQYALDPMGDPFKESVDNVRTIRAAGDRFEFYDAQGQRIDDGDVTVSSLSGDLDSGAPDILAGVISEGGLPMTSAAPGMGGAEAMRSLDDGRLQVTTAVAAAVAVAAGDRPPTQTRTYKKDKNEKDYVLDEVVTEIEQDLPNGRSRARVRMTYRDVRWKRNPEKDETRRQKRAAKGGATASLVPETPQETLGETDCELYALDCPAGGETTGGGATDACGPVGSGANVVFQHGITSDAATWGSKARTSGVRGYVRCGLQLNDEVLISMPDQGHGSHASQTQILHDRIVASGKEKYIFVGHSQGGIISRRVAQQLYAENKSNLVRGVISVGTPHQGANIARNFGPSSTLARTAEFFTAPSSCLGFSSRCARAGNLIWIIVDINLAKPAGTAAGRDLVPGSPAIQDVNRPAEQFARYGIQHYVSKRWAWARVASYSSPIPLTERSAVRAMDVTWGVVTGFGILSAIKGYWRGAAGLAVVSVNLLQTEFYWHHITAGKQDTDGVVEKSSQLYPRALLNIKAREPASHTGETKTEGSAIEVQNVMRTYLNVVVR